MGALLEIDGVRSLLERSPRPMIVEAVRDTVARVRAGALAPTSPEGWTSAIAAAVEHRRQRSLRRVINATGVVLHTNLGRAPLAPSALQAVAELAGGYSNLELDLDRGSRGSRYVHSASLLRELTGAEDALVVNNCAAALVLALNTMADGREAVLSRGELVEIGGSFRVHEIMARSGALLHEVGATNRTHLRDYARAIAPSTGALVKVHRSNFAVHGFTSDVTVAELAPLAREHGLPILHDLGSGLLVPLDHIGLVGEPTARDALAAGASVVVMSGDKLLGGPQAGLVVGDARWISAMRENPLARSYRVDKLTLAALEATLTLYREPARAMREVPALAMLAAGAGELRSRAHALSRSLAADGIGSAVVASDGAVGAGAFPDARLAGAAVALDGDAERWAERLRAGAPPVLGRIHDGRMHLDLRAVMEGELDELRRAVAQAWSAAHG